LTTDTPHAAVVAVCVLTPLPTIPAEAGSAAEKTDVAIRINSNFFMFHSNDEKEGAMSSPSHDLLVSYLLLLQSVELSQRCMSD
jgi:hypothetical protein